MATQYWRNRYFVEDAVHAGYIYHATTSSNLRATKNKGSDYRSYITNPRVRTWAFRTVIDRDRFVGQFNAERVISKREREIMDGPRDT